MTTYDSFVVFKQKRDVLVKDLMDYKYPASEVRECTLFCELEGKIDKYFRMSLVSKTNVDVDSDIKVTMSEHNSRTEESITEGYNYPDIIMEVFDKDNLTNRMNQRIDYLINSGSIIYQELMDLGVITIPCKYTNSRTDITISRIIYTDGTMSITINNVNISDSDVSLKIYFDDFSNSDIYDKLIEFYKSLESASIISSRYDDTKLLNR